MKGEAKMNEIKISKDEFKEIITKLLPEAEIKLTKKKMSINLERYDFTRNWEIDLDYLNKILEQVNEKKLKGETVMYDERSYETILKFESPHSLFDISEIKDIEKEDHDNKIRYSIGHTSKEYLLFALKNFGDQWIKNPLVKMRIRRVGYRSHYRSKQFIQEEKIKDFLDLLIKASIPARYSLQIHSESEKTVKEFEELADSFMFTISYNLSVAMIKIKFLDEYIPTERIHRVRRTSIEKFEPPRRKYIPSLVHHYQMGIATDDPMLQFISFYQILEYFFEKIYKEELFSKIRNKITNPSFSYKNDSDLNGLIKIVKSNMQTRGGAISYNENYALRLTLKKYITDLDELKEKLKEYDKTLLNYYQNNPVPFSKGNIINWNSQDTNTILENIADRIYKTRNSIIHSKESDKPKYTPFKDEKSLSKEIPLVKFMAEEAIIRSAKLM